MQIACYVFVPRGGDETMNGSPHFEEIFIESLRKPLRIRILTPEDMEAIESIPEHDRPSELILQGIYDCDEFMEKLSAVVGSELVSMMVDSRTRPLLSRLRRIKGEILEAIYRVNRLRGVRFQEAEAVLVGQRAFQFRIDHFGRIVVSEEPQGKPGSGG